MFSEAWRNNYTVRITGCSAYPSCNLSCSPRVPREVHSRIRSTWSAQIDDHRLIAECGLFSEPFVSKSALFCDLIGVESPLLPQPHTSAPLSEDCHAYRDHGDGYRANSSGSTRPVRARSDRNDCDHSRKLMASNVSIGRLQCSNRSARQRLYATVKGPLACVNDPYRPLCP